MKQVDIDAVLNEYREKYSQSYPDATKRREKFTAEAKVKRAALSARFTYLVTVEGDYWEHDELVHQLWDWFGPPDGPCDDRYPQDGEPRCEICRNDPDDENEHSWDGDWKRVWVGKTGYDYGIGDYYFSTQLQRDCMMSIIRKASP